jgi:hypothetical protein
LGKIPAAEHFEARTGRGVLAHYGGSISAVGTLEWMDELAIPIGEQARTALSRLKSEETAVLFPCRAGNRRVRHADSMRTRARNDRQLKGRPENDCHAHRRRPDRRRLRARPIEDVHSELLPEDVSRHCGCSAKVTWSPWSVTASTTRRRWLPRISASPWARPTDVAIETAACPDVDDLMKIPVAIRLSKAMRNIHQNVSSPWQRKYLLLRLIGRHMAAGMLIHEASVWIVIEWYKSAAGIG